MSMMLAPQSNSFFTVSSNAVYQSNNYGLILAVNSLQDVADLVAQGCQVLTPPPTNLLFTLRGANFNSTADQQLEPTFNAKFRPRRFVVLNASVSLTAAVGGFYTAPAKGGTALVANTQTYSTLTAALLALEATLAVPADVWPAGTPVFLSLTTPQGAAATADIYIYGDVYV
jgi:hypothetical protein